MGADPWLERWLPLLRERAGGGVLLELGCGGGRDTAALVQAGLSVVALDRSEDCLAEARRNVPGATFHCLDLRSPFPDQGRGVDAVLASLSLHYFSWPETLGIVGRIRSVLSPGGLLLCRLNSTLDHHHGALGHPTLAKDFYLVDGIPKRFFDRPAVTELFSGAWRFLSLEEMEIQRYEAPKVVWEAVLEAAPDRIA